MVLKTKHTKHVEVLTPPLSSTLKKSCHHTPNDRQTQRGHVIERKMACSRLVPKRSSPHFRMFPQIPPLQQDASACNTLNTSPLQAFSQTPPRFVGTTALGTTAPLCAWIPGHGDFHHLRTPLSWCSILKQFWPWPKISSLPWETGTFTRTSCAILCYHFPLDKDNGVAPQTSITDPGTKTEYLVVKIDREEEHVVVVAQLKKP